MSDDKKAGFCGVCGTDAEFGHADNCSAYVEELLAKLDAAKAEAERRAAIHRECVELGCLFTGVPPCCSRCGRYDRTGMRARSELADCQARLKASREEVAALREAMGKAAELVRARVEESDNECEELIIIGDRAAEVIRGLARATKKPPCWLCGGTGVAMLPRGPVIASPGPCPECGDRAAGGQS